MVVPVIVLVLLAATLLILVLFAITDWYEIFAICAAVAFIYWVMYK